MANTYSQLYIHLVFAVKYRNSTIKTTFKDDVYRYMSSIINKTGKCKAIQVGGMSDHVHILLRLDATISLSALVKELKVATTIFINDKILGKREFAWQEGYGAFSISPSHTDATTQYIRNQEQHHKTNRFIDEYQRLLSIYNIEYNADYIFSEPE